LGEKLTPDLTALHGLLRLRVRIDWIIHSQPKSDDDCSAICIDFFGSKTNTRQVGPSFPFTSKNDEKENKNNNYIALQGQSNQSEVIQQNKRKKKKINKCFLVEIYLLNQI